MLKGIPDIISPELLKVLMEMGHGDELVIADANFPAASTARELIRSDVNEISKLLNAILSLFPLDQYVEYPAALMAVVPDDPTKPQNWEAYTNIAKKHEPEFQGFEYLERFAFYERAKNAYAVLSTIDRSLYGNIILKKGVLK